MKIPVTLTVTTSPLIAAPSSLTFTTAAGDGILPPDPKTIKITGKTTAGLFSISTQGAWLSATAVVISDQASGSILLKIPVTLTVLAQPTLSVYPPKFTFRFPVTATFSAFFDGPSASQSLSVVSSVPSTRFTVSTTGTTDDPAFPISPLTPTSTGGVAPQTFYVAALGNGTAAQQSAQIVITSRGAIPPKIIVPVTIVTDSEPPILAVSPQFFRVNVTQSSTTGVIGQVFVSNLGDGDLEYTATAEGWSGFSESGVVSGNTILSGSTAPPLRVF